MIETAFTLRIQKILYMKQSPQLIYAFLEIYTK
jgi:hypothetical protein